jgi:alpha-ketoglutarate-dependent 2,4-dichlorophenoxyacetate dioxygenase
MPLSIYPVTPDFVAEVGDVDLSQPLDAQTFEQIAQAFWTYAVLVFPGQTLTQAQHLEFAQRFGPLEPLGAIQRKEDKHRIRLGLVDISNLTADNARWEEAGRRRQYSMGNRLWHTDASFRHCPALTSLLYARSVAPVGGHTEFADQRAGYDALPAATQKRLAGLVAEHSILTSRARIGFTGFSEEEQRDLQPVPQVLVRTIPQNGRRSLYVASHAGRILGMPEAEGRALIDELIAHTTQRQFVYTHRWRVNDLVMWDNRCTLHRGTDYDDLRWTREMHRATILDVANTCEQEGIHAA